MKKQSHNKEVTAMDENTFQQTWQGIESKFRNAQLAEPAEGFAERWQTRWQNAEARTQRVHRGWTAAANLAALVTMVAASGLAVWQMLQRPVAFFYSTIGAVLEFLAMFLAMVRVTIAVVMAIPAPFYMAFAGLTLVLFALWARLFQHPVLLKEQR
jgi:hypothetical protein